MRCREQLKAFVDVPSVVLTGAFIVAAGECSLLNLALLKLVGAALIVGTAVVGAGLGAALARFVEHRYDDWHIWQWEEWRFNP